MTLGLLFEEGSNCPQVIDYPDDTTTLAKIIGADYIEIIRRYIHDTEIYIIVDDCGKLKNRPIVATGQEILAGSLIVCDINPVTEDWTDLTDEKMDIVLKDNLRLNIDNDQIILGNLRFRPEHIHGVTIEKWNAATKRNRELTEMLNFYCSCKELTPNYIETALDDIIAGKENIADWKIERIE